jgi:hypothetical protein
MLSTFIAPALIITLLVCLLSAVGSDTMQGKIRAAVTLLSPIWFPTLYLCTIYVANLLPNFEVKGESRLAIFLLFAVPLAGSYPIFTSEHVPLIGKLLAIPVYYLASLALIGLGSWVLGCELGVVGCH